MSISRYLTGSMVALITPMFEDGVIDFASLEALVEFHIQSGSKAIVAVGTTGESSTLNVQEHIDLIEKIVVFVKKRIPVIAGTGANSTSEAIELTKNAKEAGADCCLLVTPYYNKPTQEGLYLHYKKIAETVDIEQILYNVPSRTSVNLAVETTSRLAEVDNIIGIKDATGDIKNVKSLLATCPPNFLLYSGDDLSALEFILAGGHGGISVTANVVPQKISSMYEAAINNNRILAKSINMQLNSLHKSLFIESNPIPVKWALYKMGKCQNGIRLPLTKLSKPAQNILQKELFSLGII